MLKQGGRQRDLFPLPAPNRKNAGCAFDVWADCDVIWAYFLSVIGALNAFAGYGYCHGHRRASLAQQSALKIVASKIDRMCARLTVLVSPGSGSDVLSLVIGGPNGPGARAVPLVASCCDVLEKSGLVDPLPYLPEDYRAFASEPSSLFPAPPPGLDKFSAPSGRDRGEYLRLLGRELCSGKVELRDSCLGGGSVFAVGKTGGKLRAIWDGGRVTEAAAQPPKPPHLASPAALLDVEAPKGKNIRVWKRDGKCLFDQLSLAPALRAYMGRPSCSAGELCDATGIRLSELSRYWTGPGRLERTTTLVPVGCVWAMGFGWSSWVAQSTMLSACRAAGLHEGAPSPVYCLATDEVVYMRPDDISKGRAAIRCLDSEFTRRGILKKADKDIDGSLEGTLIGIDLVDVSFFAAHGPKLARLLVGGIALLASSQA